MIFLLKKTTFFLVRQNEIKCPLLIIYISIAIVRSCITLRHETQVLKTEWSGVKWSHTVEWNPSNMLKDFYTKPILNIQNLFRVSNMDVKEICKKMITLNYCYSEDQLKGLKDNNRNQVCFVFLFGKQRLQWWPAYIPMPGEILTDSITTSALLTNLCWHHITPNDIIAPTKILTCLYKVAWLQI